MEPHWRVWRMPLACRVHNRVNACFCTAQERRGLFLRGWGRGCRGLGQFHPTGPVGLATLRLRADLKARDRVQFPDRRAPASIAWTLVSAIVLRLVMLIVDEQLADYLHLASQDFFQQRDIPVRLVEIAVLRRHF